eukprot:101027_1
MPRGLYQTPDTKKTEYKKYLDRSGVHDALTKVLVGLYEEPDRPVNAIDYIKKHLGGQPGLGAEDKMKKENEDLKTKIKELENSIGDLRRQMIKEDDGGAILRQINT